MEKALDLIVREGGEAVEEAKRMVKDLKVSSLKLKKMLTYFIDGWRDYTRPAIISLAYRAVGGRGVEVASIAAPLILINGAFDLHDDIIDKSYVKGIEKGKTMLGRYGLNQTLLLADALLSKGLWTLSSTLRRAGLSEDKMEEIVDLIFKLG